MRSSVAAKRWTRFLIVGCAFALLPVMSRSQVAPSPPKQFSPTQAPPNAQYAGTKTCALCHDKQAEGQRENSMARALETVADCEVLRKHPRMEFKSGKYAYTIERRGEQSVFTVTDGRETISEPILWAFGMSVMGQTYVLRYKGRLYESRVSYYNSIDALDLTLGAPSSATPASLEDALGRQMQSTDAKDCFGCHAQAAVSGSELQLEKLTPGVTCESCHGPGADHVALAKTGKAPAARDKKIFNPASLSPYDLSQQFCGACHRSWEQVQLSGLRGIGNVRFQPYRITYSRCYDPEDRRITCTACHDPHRAIEQDAPGYDGKCLACHQAKGARPAAKKVAACKVGTQNCASCHMPRYEIPGSHFQFVDHMIRVVKPNEPYPN
ncbi:MAG: multiheme c-type cytochrome [Blastocatellia bacterium]|nr:multiheme c-type cytochrome [Blastocatellia bacterium]